MTFKTLFICFFFQLLSFTISAQVISSSQFDKNSIKKIVNAMTIEEKSLMVTGAKRRNVFPQPLPGFRLKDITGVGGYTYPFLNLGIPSIMLSDGPAGLRIAPGRLKDTSSYYCTAFPVATLLASTWNTQLVESVGSAMGKETLEYGVDILLGPGMNIQRDPLGGRNFEYFSEDPYITGKMAASIVKGIQAQGVGASIKHFAVNNQETNRRTIDAVVSERALREIYLQGFKIAVKESNPWTVMSSYNKINGVYTSESKELLDGILRKEWGFKGFVLTDWYGGLDPVAQVRAGNDLLMPGLAAWSQKIDSAIRFKTINVKIIDKNIERILNVVTQTPTYQQYNFSNRPDLQKHAQIAREAATEGIVLLKNNHATLPLAHNIKKIAAFGNYSYKLIAGGTGSGMVNNKHNVSVVEGLEKAGYIIDADLRNIYTAYLKTGKPDDVTADSLITAMRKADKILDEKMFEDSLLQHKAASADMAIITILRVFGEGGDRKLNHSYYLSSDEKKLIKTVSDEFRKKGKKTLVILNIGGVIEMSSWQNMADAILLPWQPGQEGGDAITAIITGKINPSGRLATTFAIDYKDFPTSNNFPGTPREKPEKVIHEEGIYVGYRYFDSFKVKTAYEFGFGLSYTNFKYTDLQSDAMTFKDKIKVSLLITNTGEVAGKEVVQLYISAPAKTIYKPEKELKGFIKTRLLLPGESQEVSFTIGPESLASFHTAKSAWIAEKGKYTIKVGSSSANIKQTLAFNLRKELITEKVRPLMQPQVTINEIKPSGN